MFALSGHCPL